MSVHSLSRGLPKSVIATTRPILGIACASSHSWERPIPHFTVCDRKRHFTEKAGHALMPAARAQQRRHASTMNDTTLCALGASTVMLRLPHHKNGQVQLSRARAPAGSDPQSIFTTPGNASAGWTATCSHPGAARRLAGSPPLVSALCVSHHRAAKLTRSIALWWMQSYPCLELVLAFDEDDLTTAALAARALERSRILHSAGQAGDGSHSYVRRVLLHKITNRSTALGRLRTQVASLATGEYLTQWDDDDAYHPDRVSWSLAALLCSGARAAVLDAWVTVDLGLRLAYEATRYDYEGTIIAESAALRNDCYPAGLSRGEDSVCVRKLRAEGQLAAFHAPQLYYYLVHGNNTFAGDHFLLMAKQASMAWKVQADGRRRRALTRPSYDRLLRLFDEVLRAGESLWHPDSSVLQRLLPPTERAEVWLGPSAFACESGDTVPLTRALIQGQQGVPSALPSSKYSSR